MGSHGLGAREIREFYVELEKAKLNDWASLIGMHTDSEQWREIYKWLTASPAMREWVGPRLAKGLTENSITIENKTWEATLEFLTDDVRRDKTSQIDKRIADLARRSLALERSLLSTLIINGSGDTSGLAYDGQYFFDDDHSEGSSGTQKNLLTVAEVTQLDVTTATAPTALEAAQAVLGVIAYMGGILDDQGEPMNETAREFVVMTGTALAPAFMGACTQKTVSGNVDNPLAQSDYKITHALNPRLTGWTTNFAVFRADSIVKSFILQQEEELTIQIVGVGSEYETLNNKQLFGVKKIMNVGFGLWQHAAKATLS